MEAIITWAKENFNLISLGVGVLGVLIGIISVIQAKKQVKLDAMSEEEKAAMAQKEEDKKAKQAEKDAAALQELNAIRESIGRPAVASE